MHLIHSAFKDVLLEEYTFQIESERFPKIDAKNKKTF